jgi:D-sedoheptulose 7-phosphate isomerase
MSFILNYLQESEDVTHRIARDQMDAIDAMAAELMAVRARGGRLFLIGVGGSAANCSHAAADFRTLCGIQAYAFDNLANLTALTNDEGWDYAYLRWLMGEHASPKDLLYVMSVGGGTDRYSRGLRIAMDAAVGNSVPIIGVAGRDGGHLAKVAKACVIVPTINPAHITPHTESMQAVIWHLLVSHPLLKQQKTAWEGK